MIRIDLDTYKPSPAWQAKADAILQELELAGTATKRKAIIKKHSKLWGQLKDELLAKSHGKCWFSETKFSYSYAEIEHFRPKNGVRNFDNTRREGYWWLAFDWNNYRICAKKGNVVKGNHFGLKSGSFIATPSDRDVLREEILLLDPTNGEDPFLISFDENGKAIPQSGIEPWQVERVEYTIEKMSLDNPTINEGRMRVWLLCRRKINHYFKLKKQLGIPGIASFARDETTEVFKDLKDLVNPNAEFSAVAIECLQKSGDAVLSRVAMMR
jgi:uncharacterized protein (TIGR02646 family)